MARNLHNGVNTIESAHFAGECSLKQDIARFATMARYILKRKGYFREARSPWQSHPVTRHTGGIATLLGIAYFHSASVS